MWFRNKETGKEHYVTDAVTQKRLKNTNDYEQIKKEESTEPDYSELTKAQLKKVNNDDLRTYLDEEGIEYSSEDNKDDLIALIVGEDNGDQ